MMNNKILYLPDILSSGFRRPETPVQLIVLLYSATGKTWKPATPEKFPYLLIHIQEKMTQNDFRQLLGVCPSEHLLFVDLDKVAGHQISPIADLYLKQSPGKIYYGNACPAHFFRNVIDKNLKMTDPQLLNAAFLAGESALFRKTYAGSELSASPLRSIAYSLQKNFIRYRRLPGNISYPAPADTTAAPEKKYLLNYRFSLLLPFHYLISGQFFRHFLRQEDSVQRNMVCRMLMILFAVFSFIYMPYISKDFGISGDEFVDQRHAGYVLNYYLHGDKAAVNQPRTFLHFYGISMQIIAEGICQLFRAEDYFAVRHAMTAIIGACGIWFAGLLGLRWGGGLCGLLSMLLLFFTPRYFGNSMNNMKDIPFAAGYVMSAFYFIRLFDHYPCFRLRYLLGSMIGISLAFGSRSGGLMLYPYLLMYGGLFYILRTGIKEFYKFYKYRRDIGRILAVILVIFIFSYLLSIALWPYALENPVSGIAASLKQFTNFTVALRLIFEGREIMSNMVPIEYVPTFMSVGLPIVLLAGFAGYLIQLLLRRKEFTLISWFLLFAAIFPVFWVMYKNSNLYGGLRHFMFVVSIMSVVAARCWSLLIQSRYKILRLSSLLLFFILLCLPFAHMVRNHPHEYIYFNELIGGIRGAYGKFDTDYYFNSLKHATQWFKKEVKLPDDHKTIIITNLAFPLEQYFKNDTNVIVRYSRYYEKYSKDWDYAIWANEYITPYQLTHGLFPPPGAIYVPRVDGYPVGAVIKRPDKEELKAFGLFREQKFEAALAAFEQYAATHPELPEEIASKMSRLYYMTNQPGKAREYADKALKKHPLLAEALYISTLTYIQAKDYDQAMKEVRKMLESNNSSVDGHYLRALIYYHLQKYKEAVDDLNKTLALNPSHHSALSLGGEIMLLTGNHKMALSLFQRILKNKYDIKAATSVADCYCRMQNYTEMEKRLQEVLQHRPGYLPAYLVKIRSLLQQKDLKQAGHMLVQLATINDSAELFVLRSLYLTLTGHPQEARRMIDEALRIAPSDPEANALKLKMKKQE